MKKYRFTTMYWSDRSYNNLIINLLFVHISTAYHIIFIFKPIESHAKNTFNRASLFVNYGLQSRNKLLCRFACYWKVIRAFSPHFLDSLKKLVQVMERVKMTHFLYFDIDFVPEEVIERITVRRIWFEEKQFFITFCRQLQKV